MNWKELHQKFEEFEKDNTSGKHLEAEVIFTEDSFTKPYTKEQRTYRFSSDNKAFKPSMIGYSIFASCIDGTDQGVRIERYMKEEQNYKDPQAWEVEDVRILNE
jgi:hypothetical protein